MSRYLTVTLETWKKQMKSVSFWMMVFMPFVVLLVTSIIGYYIGKDDASNKVAIVASEEIQDKFIKNDVLDFVFEDEDKAKKDLEDKKVVAYAKIYEEKGILNMKYYSQTMGKISSMYLETLVKNIQNSMNSNNAKVSKSQAKILTRNPKIEYFEVKDNISNPFTMGAYFILMLAMYMFLIIYSNIMIMDVAVEKGTKMLEFIFSSIKPKTYFAGKISGNLLVIITHAFVYALVFIIALIITKTSGLLDKLEKFGLVIPDMGSLAISILIMLGFVIIGILLYMIVAAMLGSLVAKQEDASKMATPIMLIPIISYVLSISFIGKSPNLLIKVLSYIPFFSTFFMPMRMIYADVNAMYSLVSLLILVLAVFISYSLCAKVYKNNILNYSSDRLFFRKKATKL